MVPLCPIIFSNCFATSPNMMMSALAEVLNVTSMGMEISWKPFQTISSPLSLRHLHLFLPPRRHGFLSPGCCGGKHQQAKHEHKDRCWFRHCSRESRTEN